jgi:hypothetical protein
MQGSNNTLSDSDLVFRTPTENKMIFVCGSFISYYNFYLAVCSGFNMTELEAMDSIVHTDIYISDYYKLFLN